MAKLIIFNKPFQVPQSGEKITVNADLSINVPNHPIIPFIEGDGIGVDITPVMVKVIDSAVAKAYDVLISHYCLRGM